jgi:DNA-binding phage protein
VVSVARQIVDDVVEQVREVGVTEVARRSGYDRGQIYRLFNTRRASLEMICDIAEAVGMRLHVGVVRRDG